MWVKHSICVFILLGIIIMQQISANDTNAVLPNLFLKAMEAIEDCEFLGKCALHDYNQEDRSKHATLFDFTTAENLNDWYEVSDSVREVGKSKGVLVLQKTRVFQRAVFFSLLNPQPNGACFAGVKTETMFDLSKYESITLNIRGQGSASIYKVVLKHKNQNEIDKPAYEQTFEAPMDEEFVTVRLDLDKFKPYFRGKLLNDTEPLDKSHITSIGLQVAGGVYLPNKQSGVSSLEIDWIRADI